ncbi:MAG: 2-C-methyl-D-erythritol 4-phosphate cytidylyltransferase [Deltaproteobacteria bacterium]|nr:MAG: 2-C-methyl-D-erythritol 4-phosphate cytidylyltransferase [Deltaproteobacteria bacterium]
MDRANKIAAIIVAAGHGERMRSAQRKQYMMLRKHPVLAHTMSAFEKCDIIEEIFLVVPPGDEVFCQKQIVDPIRPRKPVCLVSGGASRQESVFNGLKATEGRFDLVVIHDGVRPLVKVEKIVRCVEMAEKYGACILALPASDTVKTVDEFDRVVVTMKRDTLRMIQTPQAFYYNLILGAHMAAQSENYVGTDDAELVEMCGEVIKTIPGDPCNIKVTTLDDLKIAEALLES